MAGCAQKSGGLRGHFFSGKCDRWDPDQKHTCAVKCAPNGYQHSGKESFRKVTVESQITMLAWYFSFCKKIENRKVCNLTNAFSFSSVQFSRSVKSDSLRPHEPQHARPPCPSPTPEVYPNPCPLSR